MYIRQPMELIDIKKAVHNLCEKLTKYYIINYC